MPQGSMVRGELLLDAQSDRAGRSNFNTTHWSVVLAAAESLSPESATALEQLCQAYWYPLYAFVRREGHNSEDAKDLVQEFFARLLSSDRLRMADRARGRFRTFLLTSLRNFLINEWKRANRTKRGGGEEFISLDEKAAEGRFASEPATDHPPDTLYDRGWAWVVLERAFAALRAEFDESGKEELFDRLKEFVWGEKSVLSYADMAEELGMTEGAVKVALHRLRRRFGELLRAELARTVADPAEVKQELRYLISVIRADGHNCGNQSTKKL